MAHRTRGFHLKLTRAGNRTYARLARSIRDGTRIRTQILCSFGAVTSAQVERLKAWVDSDPLLPPAPERLLADLSQLRIRRSWSYGRVALGHFLWRQLGVHQAVLEALDGTPRKGRIARLIETMVLNRLDDPTSKLGVIEWLKGSATPFLLGLRTENLHDNLLYRAMDHLWSHRDALEKRLYERVVRPTTRAPSILCHDLTSSYYEGEGGPLAHFGYSRDHRGDRPQITWGMVVTPEGLPITIQVYPGNTTDNTTVVRMRQRLTEVFGLKEGIYVGDRGMKTQDVLEDLHAHGFRYVLAETNRFVEEIILQAKKLPPVAVGHQNVAREVIDREGRRFIVLLNEERRKTELEVLERRIAEGNAIVEQVRKGWRRNPDRHHHALLQQAQATLAAKGLSDLFDLDWDEDSFQGLIAPLKDRVARARRLAGWWVLTTDTDLPAEEVVRLYTGLAVIEAGWRELKSVLEVRPLRHRLDRRVEAHLLICVLAYLIKQSLALRVKELGLTGNRAIEAFRTVTLNEAELEGTGVRRLLVTELEVGQKAVLKAVGISEERMQVGWRRLE
ncbi:MAG: IS1634 family transposase [Thermoplasmata archaeon]